MDAMRKTLVLRLILAGLASLALALLCAPAVTLAQGNTLCVGEEGDYTTIQEAVNAAQDGDAIRIAGGDYTENLVITKTLTLSGGWLADCSDAGDEGTSITADAGRLLTIDPQRPGVKVVLNDIAMEQGNATGLGGALGAVSCQRTTVTDNTFERNLGASADGSGGLGGAVAVTWGDQVRIHRNLLRTNSGQVSPAANEDEATSVLALIGNDLQRPNAPMIDLTTVAVTENYLLDSGQGVAVGAAPQNFAISVQATDQFTIANNVIAGSTLGGIVAIYAKVTTSADVTLETRGTVRNNTLADNGKYGLWLLDQWSGETLTAVNNIIAGHTYGAEGEDLFGPASPVDLNYSLFYSNTANIGPTAGDSIASTHALEGDPRFLAPLTHDYHLMPTSPAIDAGDPAGVPPAPPIDIEESLRPFGARVDIGAYEWHGQGAFLPAVMKQ